MHATDVGAEAWRVCVFWYGDGDLHVVGCTAALELRFCLDYCVSLILAAIGGGEETISGDQATQNRLISVPCSAASRSKAFTQRVCAFRLAREYHVRLGLP